MIGKVQIEKESQEQYIHSDSKTSTASSSKTLA